MEDLRKELELALYETEKELKNFPGDEDEDLDERLNAHVRDLKERRTGLNNLLETLKQRSGDNPEEIEIKEDWTEEDIQIDQERRSGRRVAHRSSYTHGPGHPMDADTPPAHRPSDRQQVLKDKIMERTVTRERILEADRRNAERMMRTEMEKLTILREGAVKGKEHGLHPPDCTDKQK